MGIRKSRLVWVAILAVALAALFAFSHTNKDKPQQATQPAQNTQVQQTPKTTEVNYKGVEGQNALQLLKQSHRVETKNYEGIGELVTSIDDTAADSKHFWSFYVNGQQSQVGAGTYVTKSGDNIVWKLEEIK